ncbi:hypothetical protein G6F56_000595 [Rhizopus delemar]|uniref:Protein phosphatase 1 regulatory subunit 21 N-terminal domain-containing protein n=1 Tax=Rhizopus stolonifer TaxID=4846 RepID=A0A367J4C5_RHIST|nr:hypothetical protein G6F56_000595 [Rhizopus delemar]RCH84765.1 hypothetical protein CU098_002935 [Rhizopus stolonifer]
MSDGLFSKHAILHAGTIPVSAEELSQRYAKLFQQYSRLKAQHTILKKAVIKALQEQASNVALQGDMKKKEKELRKLQEQLDLLSFHNERLTKRIQAVQDSEQKGSYFSLLGGSAKKELEKNTQALDAANSDLERKILENEQLHDELTEKQSEFTASINVLLKQIQDLEDRVDELEAENMSLQSSTQEVNTMETKDIDLSKEEEQLLRQKTEELKSDLSKKTRLLEEQEKKSKENDARLLSEIRSLRAILIAKMGHMENKNLKDILPGSQDALENLEKEAKNYIQSIQNNDTKEPKSLPHEIAEKLAISHETWRKEFENVTAELESKKKEMNELLEKAQQGQAQESENKDQLRQMQEKFEEESQQLEEKHKEMIEQLNTQHNEQINHHLSAKEDVVKRVQELETVNDKLEQENIRLQQEIEQIHINRPSVVSSETQTETEIEKTEDEGDEEVFIYPKKAENEEEDEEAFVYTGVDALPTSAEKDLGNQDAILELKTSYEKQVNELTEKLQMSDSKALRLENMYKNAENQLASKEQLNQSMKLEIEKLNKKVKHVEDMMATTETNYQKQVDAMTELITTLQSS